MKTRTVRPVKDPAVVRHKGGVLELLCKALESQWRRYRKRLRQCQRRFSQEAVHDSRVETRRLLATVELLCAFIPERELKKARRALKKHLDAFDRLRDTQVQLTYVGHLLHEFSAATGFHDWLRKREKRFIRETQKAVRKIKTRRLGGKLAEFEAALQGRKADLTSRQAFAKAERAVQLAFAQVAKLCRRVNPGETKTIHRTRIAFKRFRYMVDALSPMLPAVSDQHRQAMRSYQSMMGDIQDVQVMLFSLDKFTRQGQKKPLPEACRLREELTQRRELLIHVYLNAAGQLRKFWPPGKPPASRRAKLKRKKT